MRSLLNSFRRRLALAASSADFMEVERRERIFYLEYVSEGMKVFDVGANVGELTLLFSRFVGESGTVHSFEASSQAFQKLELVCAATGCRNVTLDHLALADKNGSIRLNIYDEPYSCFNSQALRPLRDYGLDIEPVGIEVVPATTIDDYCAAKRVEFVDLLKIDVEGAELQVLKGAYQMLQSKKIGCCVFEFGQTTFDMGNDPKEMESIFERCDYRIRNVVGGDPVFPGRNSVTTAKYSMHIAVPA